MKLEVQIAQLEYLVTELTKRVNLYGNAIEMLLKSSNTTIEYVLNQNNTTKEQENVTTNEVSN